MGANRGAGDVGIARTEGRGCVDRIESRTTSRVRVRRALLRCVSRLIAQAVGARSTRGISAWDVRDRCTYATGRETRCRGHIRTVRAGQVDCSSSVGYEWCICTRGDLRRNPLYATQKSGFFGTLLPPVELSYAESNGFVPAHERIENYTLHTALCTEK